MTSSRSTRARLSVCLIARDEARHLPGCLETVRDWADEVILIDTGSTDATREIARRAGAKVFPVSWDGDFSAARNAALEKAGGDWVLFIDCDERLDYVSGRRLPRWTSALSAEDVCQVRLLTPAGRGSSLTLLAWSPRLIRRDPALRFRGALHERLYRGDAPLEASQGTDITIHHTGYSDPDHRRVQRRRAAAIDPAETGEVPPDAGACLKLANHYVALDEFARAEGLYRILLGEAAVGDLKPLVYWNLAVSSYRAGASEAAFAELDRAAQEFPTLVGTHLVRAQILMEAGRADEALAPIDLLIESADERLTDYPDLPASMAYLLTLKGACLAASGDLPAAAILLEEALARDQSLFAAHDRRADLLAGLGAHDEALSGYLRAAALRPDLGGVRIKAGLLLEQMGRTEDGVVFIREAARLDPESGPEARAVLRRIEGLPEEEESAEEAEGGVERPTAAETEDDVERPAAAETEAGAAWAAVDEVEAVPGSEPPRDGIAETEPPPEAIEVSSGPAGEPAIRDDSPEPTPIDHVQIAPESPSLFPEPEPVDAAPAPNPEPVSAAPPSTEPRAAAEAPRSAEPQAADATPPSTEPPPLTRVEEAVSESPRWKVELLEKELAEHPGDHERQFQLGLVHLSLGEADRAEPLLRAAIRPTAPGLSAENRGIALAELARCALDRGDVHQALSDARSALTLAPESLKARLVLAAAAHRNQHFTEAAQEYRRILDAASPEQSLEAEGADRAGVSREMGICLYRAQKFDEAAEAFAYSLTDHPRDALGRLFLGNALAHLGRFESAYQAFHEAVEIDPELTDARGNLEVMALELGYRHYDAGRPADALRLVPGWTRHPELLFLKAISQHGVKEIAGARQTLELLNTIDDSFAEAHWNLALVCRALGDRPAAQAALSRFRQLAPGDTRAQALEEALQAAE